MAVVRQVVGQSAYDLTLQTYGSQDKLIQFCQENNIQSLDTITPQIDYTYNENEVQNEKIKGYVFATDVQVYNRIFSDEFSIEFA